jgi:toxin ParE1/3/4
MKYQLRQLAFQNLETVWLYAFEKWSVEQADGYFDFIINEIEYISNNPYSGYDYSSVRKSYVRSRTKSHFIFYRMNKKNNIVEIIRLSHQRMDIENRLMDERKLLTKNIVDASVSGHFE